MFELTDRVKKEFIEHIKNRTLTNFELEKCNDFISRNQENNLREELVELGFYFLVTEQLVDNVYELLKGKRCLEIMAGNGFFAECLYNCGLDIISTDSKEWGLKDYGNVIEMDALSAIQKYKDSTDVLIICWPYLDNTAYQAIKAWGKDKQILVCAEIGGCCADSLFDAAFNREVVDVGHQRFYGLHDHFYIGNYQEIDEQNYNK